MAIYKNKDGQKVAVFAVDADGVEKTGDAANITAQISKDGAACDATNDANPTELDATDAPGVYLFDLTQAETNADLVIISAVSGTADITIRPLIIYTEPEQRAADVTAISGDTTAADNLELDYDGTGYAKTNSTIGTTTTNTDMRGTDGANTTVPDAAGTAAGLIGALNDFDGTGATLHTDYDAAKTAAQAGDAMTLAAEAVDAAALKADAVTAIQSGLATSNAQTTAQNDLDTITGADGVTLATAQGLYAPAKAGAEMDIVDAPNSTAVTAIQAGLSTHSAADVKTALEADGSKLDHLWEMTEDDGGTRRLTANALEQAPSSTGLDAAATRAALGMAAANLDTQLGTVAKTGADSDTLETLSDQLDSISGGGAGSGDVAVDQDTGGTNALAIFDADGLGIDGATIRAYLKADYTASPSAATVRATAISKSDGGWVAPMMLDSGETYTITAEKNGVYNLNTGEVTVP